MENENYKEWINGYVRTSIFKIYENKNTIWFLRGLIPTNCLKKELKLTNSMKKKSQDSKNQNTFVQNLSSKVSNVCLRFLVMMPTEQRPQIHWKKKMLKQDKHRWYSLLKASFTYWSTISFILKKHVTITL